MRASCTKGPSEPLTVSQHLTWVSGQKEQGGLAWPVCSRPSPELQSQGALDPADLWAWPLRWGGLASLSEPSDPHPFPRLSIPSEAQTWPPCLGTSPLPLSLHTLPAPFHTRLSALGAPPPGRLPVPHCSCLLSAGFCVFSLLTAPQQTGVGSAWLGCAEQVREVQCLRAQSLDLGGSGGKGHWPSLCVPPQPSKPSSLGLLMPTPGS